MKYAIPLHITIEPQIVRKVIDKNLTLCFYTEEQKEKLWGIYDIKRDEKNRIVSYTLGTRPEGKSYPLDSSNTTQPERSSIQGLFGATGIKDHLDLINSDYYLEFDGTQIEDAKKYCTALKLHKPGTVGFLVALSSGSPSAMFSSMNPFSGDEYKIKRGELNNISNIYSLINNSKVKNKDVLLARFLYASSKDADGIKGFIEYVSLMESIIVQDGKRGEIAYKFRIRGSIKLAKTKKDIANIYQVLSDAYNVRSEWLHKSNDKLQSTLCSNIELLARTCILEYLDNDKNYDSKSLDVLVMNCLQK